MIPPNFNHPWNRPKHLLNTLPNMVKKHPLNLSENRKVPPIPPRNIYIFLPYYYHILPRCNNFQKESVEEHIKFTCKGGLCFNCLFQGHIERFCSKNSFCKVTGCELKHSMYLHRKPNTSVADKSCGPGASCVPLDSCQPSSSDAFQQSLKNATNAQIDVTGASVSTAGLPLVPVMVKCARSSEVTMTYTFLDSGSNTMFFTTELLQT